jgi:hypothetical protein
MRLLARLIVSHRPAARDSCVPCIYRFGPGSSSPSRALSRSCSARSARSRLSSASRRASPRRWAPRFCRPRIDTVTSSTTSTTAPATAITATPLPTASTRPVLGIRLLPGHVASIPGMRQARHASLRRRGGFAPTGAPPSESLALSMQLSSRAPSRTRYCAPLLSRKDQSQRGRYRSPARRAGAILRPTTNTTPPPSSTSIRAVTPAASATGRRRPATTCSARHRSRAQRVDSDVGDRPQPTRGTPSSARRPIALLIE